MHGNSSLNYSRATILAVCDLLDSTSTDTVAFTANNLQTGKFLPANFRIHSQYQSGAMGALVVLGFLKEKRTSQTAPPEYTATRRDLVRLRRLAEPKAATRLSAEMNTADWDAMLAQRLSVLQRNVVMVFRGRNNAPITESELESQVRGGAYERARINTVLWKGKLTHRLKITARGRYLQFMK
jgi:hypothetical protein